MNTTIAITPVVPVSAGDSAHLGLVVASKHIVRLSVKPVWFSDYRVTHRPVSMTDDWRRSTLQDEDHSPTVQCTRTHN